MGAGCLEAVNGQRNRDSGGAAVTVAAGVWVGEWILENNQERLLELRLHGVRGLMKSNGYSSCRDNGYTQLPVCREPGGDMGELATERMGAEEPTVSQSQCS